LEAKRKTTFGAWFATFVLCYFFWILLTGSFDWQELVAGAVVSAGVALFSARWFVHESPGRFFSGRLFILIWYCVAIFPWELIKANCDMAKRALSPKLKINPGIIKVPVDVPTEYGKTMLANSITLTPGTITVDIDEHEGQTWYYIHWIDVVETDRTAAGEIIKGRMEKWLRRIWQ
jgi:multicomponent Na+:H+ antiporter subunit E